MIPTRSLWIRGIAFVAVGTLLSALVLAALAQWGGSCASGRCSSGSCSVGVFGPRGGGVGVRVRRNAAAVSVGAVAVAPVAPLSPCVVRTVADLGGGSSVPGLGVVVCQTAAGACVLTCSHLSGSALTCDGVPAIPIWIDEARDLRLYRAALHGRPAMQTRSQLSAVGSECRWYTQGCKVSGRLAWASAQLAQVASTAVIQGDSGGPVWNTDGKLIGILVGKTTDTGQMVFSPTVDLDFSKMCCPSDPVPAAPTTTTPPVSTLPIPDLTTPTIPIQGPAGKDGKDGVDGKPGRDGIDADPAILTELQARVAALEAKIKEPITITMYDFSGKPRGTVEARLGDKLNLRLRPEATVATAPRR